MDIESSSFFAMNFSLIYQFAVDDILTVGFSQSFADWLRSVCEKTDFDLKISPLWIWIKAMLSRLEIF
jgi:hypothetical protein